MKTIELKWVEDDNHVVAEDAFTGLKELIDNGVFQTLKCDCKDDKLFITGEQDELDKAVLKIQKAYAKYGQIIIKEQKEETGLRIESFDDNVQEIFDYTVNQFNDFKQSKNESNSITKLGEFQFKFKKLKDAASKSDKAIIQKLLDEINEMSDNVEIKKIKPIRKLIEAKINPEKGDTVDDVIVALKAFGYGPNVSKALVNANMEKVLELLKNGNKCDVVAKILDKMYMNEDIDNNLRKQLSNTDNWGIIEEDIDRETYNSIFNRVADLYADETGMSFEDAQALLMDNDEVGEYIVAGYDENEIVSRLLSESTKTEQSINESLLSPSELKKKLTRVASKWASIEGITYEEAYDTLRKRKSVKDMLDFYSVDEIIDDLKKKKKEVDDDLDLPF